MCRLGEKCLYHLNCYQHFLSSSVYAPAFGFPGPWRRLDGSERATPQYLGQFDLIYSADFSSQYPLAHDQRGAPMAVNLLLFLGVFDVACGALMWALAAIHVAARMH
jgi:hypothetical protein